MSRAGAVFGFVIAGLVTTGCGDDGRSGDATTLPSTTNPSTTATTNGTETADTSGPSTTIEPDSSGGDPTTASTDDASETAGGPAICSYSCATDDDCTVDGDNIGFRCQNGECVLACTADDFCVGFHSGWTLFPCTSSAECDLDVCVLYEGGPSGCAFTPAAIPCADIGLVEAQRMDTEGGMQTVCVHQTAICTDLGDGMECHVPCTATSCGALTCGADGICRCEDFPECYMEQLGNICDSDGQCQQTCSSPADCPETNIDNDVTVCD